MTEKKVRKHNLTDKHPVISAILFGILGFIVMQALVVAINSIIGGLIEGYPNVTGPVGTIIATVLLLLFFKWWFKPEYLGSIKGSDYESVWLFVGTYAVFLLVTFIIDRLFSGTKAAIPVLSNALISLLAGMTEEASFRGFMVPVLMRKHSKKSLMMPILVPAIVFALVHGLNGRVGAGVLVTILQVINCVFFGAALTIIYLISGNIIIPIVVHVVHDLLAFSYEGAAETEGIMTGGITADMIGDTVAALVMFVVVMYFITRPKNTEKVLDIWKRKWITEGGKEIYE